MADATDGQPDYDTTDAIGSFGREMGLFSGDLPAAESSDFWSDRYNMKHSERGIAVIINNKVFAPETGLSTREGTDVDAAKMYELLNMLGFEEIVQKNNLSVKAMKNLLRGAAKQDHSNKDCFVCVILSHGDEGYVNGVDTMVAIDDLVAPFKGDQCPSLAGKPKLFFIQACRGTLLDDGVDAHDGESGEPTDVRRIPTEADFLMAYSVTPGYFAWRNNSKGSWFIQAIFEVVSELWRTKDLLTMMTRVNRHVAFKFQSKSKHACMSEKKQIPCITSMLTKDVYFSEK